MVMTGEQGIFNANFEGMGFGHSLSFELYRLPAELDMKVNRLDR